MSNETAADRRNQQEVCKLLEGFWGCEMRTLAEHDRTDHYAIKGTHISAAVEIKCRLKDKVETFDTIFFALRKWQSLLQTAWAFGVTGAFVCRFSDWLGWVNVRNVNEGTGCMVIWAGRNDRDLPNDHEPIITVPRSLFHTLARLDEQGAIIRDERGRNSDGEA